ncbi:hypothetical protein APHMUC_1324 [Anaplasma phagocytophilum str. ApMUC09]|uniref:Uncharacterized protein n=1 Tax=Anaplasma phagocytophilum str. ApMUC09 TaxID=1359152 RepID=A0A0F3N9U7_ANAPH|nr:hypothetical protein APHMUC_1324 [Anaplasma phagocytophilum str. ApMUC09]
MYGINNFRLFYYVLLEIGYERFKTKGLSVDKTMLCVAKLNFY